MIGRLRMLRRLAVVATAATTVAVAANVPLAGAARGPLTTGVVEVETRLGYVNAAGAATGMVLTSSGRVLTNNHVIRGATEIRVRVPESGRTYRARVLGYSVRADVALLKLRGASGLPTVSVGDSSRLRIGQNVTAVGNAGGTGTLTTTIGTITALDRTITVGDQQGGYTRLTHLIGTDADLRRGDSGGPLFDSAGRVIGVNTAASAELDLRSNETDGYAIPINRATSISRQIVSGRASDAVHVGATPFLGVTVEAVNASSGSIATGNRVTSVRRDSPAARAGLTTGDVIVALNGHEVRTPSGLVALLLRWRPGDKVRVAWVGKNGNRQAATVTLASGPPQ